MRPQEGPRRVVTTQLQLHQWTFSPNEVATSTTTSAIRYELSALADLNSVYIIHTHYALYVNCSMNLT